MNKEEITKSIDEGLKILKQEPSFIFNLEEIKAIEHLSNYPTNWDFCFEVDKRAIDTTLGLISKLQKEIEERDKVIDKMAKTIAGLQLYDFGRKEYFTLENEDEVIEYFYKKVEEENV